MAQDRTKRRSMFAILAVAVLLACLVNYLLRKADSRDAVRPAGNPTRIVSLSPSITEILFALELGDRVVGVTRYCTYPPDAQNRALVGGYFDPNYEAILALRPDLVLTRKDHTDAIKHLRGLDVPIATVNHRDLAGVIESVSVIGVACGAEDKARDLRAGLQRRLDTPAETGTPVRTLICIGRKMGEGTVRDVTITGADGYYDRILAAAGGTNAYTGTAVPFPVVSAEGILTMNPDVIVELAPGLASQGLTPDSVRHDWDELPELRAHRNGRIHVLTNDYTVIPGPRFVHLLDDLAGILQERKGTEGTHP